MTGPPGGLSPGNRKKALPPPVFPPRPAVEGTASLSRSCPVSPSPTSVVVQVLRRRRDSLRAAISSTELEIESDARKRAERKMNVRLLRKESREQVCAGKSRCSLHPPEPPPRRPELKALKGARASHEVLSGIRLPPLRTPYSLDSRDGWGVDQRHAHIHHESASSATLGKACAAPRPAGTRVD